MRNNDGAGNAGGRVQPRAMRPRLLYILDQLAHRPATTISFGDRVGRGDAKYREKLEVRARAFQDRIGGGGAR